MRIAAIRVCAATDCAMNTTSIASQTRVIATFRKPYGVNGASGWRNSTEVVYAQLSYKML